MSGNKQNRGLVCMFCGEVFGYAGQIPDEVTIKTALDHEALCPHNPYKAEISRLRDALGVIARNVDAGAVHSDYAKRILANISGQPQLAKTTKENDHV